MNHVDFLLAWCTCRLSRAEERPTSTWSPSRSRTNSANRQLPHGWLASRLTTRRPSGPNRRRTTRPSASVQRFCCTIRMSLRHLIRRANRWIVRPVRHPNDSFRAIQCRWSRMLHDISLQKTKKKKEENISGNFFFLDWGRADVLVTQNLLKAE